MKIVSEESKVRELSKVVFFLFLRREPMARVLQRSGTSI